MIFLPKGKKKTLGGTLFLQVKLICIQNGKTEISPIFISNWDTHLGPNFFEQYIYFGYYFTKPIGYGLVFKLK